MVSMNTSKIPYRPCLTGSVSEVAAWAMGAEPRPASLEKTPRATPFCTMVLNAMPTAPPKAEIRPWFFFGPLVALGMPIWIDRKSPRRSAQYAERFRETLTHGISMLVYPEGTSTDGKHGLLPFKSTPFASLPEGVPIQPLLTFYRETPANAAPGAWFGDVSFPSHVRGVLALREIRVDVFVLPEMMPLPGEGRKELAGRVRAAMEKEYARHEGMV